MLEYQFTIDDPQVWTRPWTAMFRFEKDDGQYELVEYACHEGNYGMTNILSGSRVRDAAAESRKIEPGRTARLPLHSACRPARISTEGGGRHPAAPPRNTCP